MNRAITVTEVSVMLLDEHEARAYAGPAGARHAGGAESATHVEPVTLRSRPAFGSAVAGPTWRWAERTRAVSTPPPTALPPRIAREAAISSHPAADTTLPAGSAGSGARTEVRIAPALLRAMEIAASVRGRPMGEVWAEAAREWLLRHAEDDDPQPPSPATAAPRSLASRSTRDRCWTAIDVLLGDLRAPHLAPVQPAAEPAA